MSAQRRTYLTGALDYDEMHLVLAIYSPFSFVLVRLRFASSSFPVIETSC